MAGSLGRIMTAGAANLLTELYDVHNRGLIDAEPDVGEIRDGTTLPKPPGYTRLDWPHCELREPKQPDGNLSPIGGRIGGCSMIRKLKSGEYRLYSRKLDPKTHKRKNLGTFKTRDAAEKHEREVQYFKHH